MPNSLLQWIAQQRSSTRLAYILQMLTRIASALLSLVWTPLLIGAMGKTLYGTFLSFQSVATLGSLGDLGMGGAINIETSRLLGRKDDAGLQQFLAVARAAFVVMAVCLGGLFIALAPWLPQWLNFHSSQAAGPLPLLFVVGGLGAALVIISSYINNVNYGAVNLTWPILPTFVLVQLGLLAHWLLAVGGSPLWIQYLPYVFAAALIAVSGWYFIRRSHPQLASIVPLAFDRAKLREILAKSFWVYLYCIGGTVYIITDRLVINAGFGAANVPPYQLNFKLCELALFVIGSASLVSMPKISVWVASPDYRSQERAIRETTRLNRFQTFLGCVAVLGYVSINDRFMNWWLGEGYQVPLLWQAAFAANMGVTAAGYAGYELAARCGSDGLRLGAISVAIAVLVKVTLSYFAMIEKSILLLALSTVVSQSLAVLLSAWFACKVLGASWWRLSAFSWLISVALVAFATVWKASLWTHGLYGQVGFAVAAALLLWLISKLIGLNLGEVRTELLAVRSIFRKSPSSRPEDAVL